MVNWLKRVFPGLVLGLVVGMVLGLGLSWSRPAVGAVPAVVCASVEGSMSMQTWLTSRLAEGKDKFLNTKTDRENIMCAYKAP